MKITRQQGLDQILSQWVKYVITEKKIKEYNVLNNPLKDRYELWVSSGGMYDITYAMLNEILDELISEHQRK